MSTSDTRISAVILSFNSADHLPAALDSLIDALSSSRERDEIWVVDNGSRDDSRAVIEERQRWYPDLVFPIFLDENRGTTRSRNLALRESSGRYVLIMDSDVEIPRGSIDRLVASADHHSACGLVAPRLCYPNGMVQLSVDSFPTVGRKVARILFLKAMERAIVESDRPEAVDYAISALWLLKREVVERVGLFDENIFYSPEDVDYCLRVWKAGFQVWYDPTVTVYHKGQELSRKPAGLSFSWSHLRGLFYLFGKHRYCLGLSRLHRELGITERGRGRG